MVIAISEGNAQNTGILHNVSGPVYPSILCEISDTINLIDKEIIDTERVDSIKITLHPVTITNAKLKSVIDNFEIIDDDNKHNNYLYMIRDKRGVYEFWKVNPMLRMSQEYHEDYTFGFYQVGYTYIFIGKSAKKDVKVKNDGLKVFELISYPDFIANIDPVLMFDLKTVDPEKPIKLRF